MSKDKQYKPKSKVEILNLNNYERVDPQSLLQIGTKYITNGTDNNFFYLVEDRYLGSPTLQAVVDNYVNYTLGEGLEAVEGIDQEVLDKIIPRKNLRQIVHEYKLQGNSPIQVSYAKSGTGKPAKLFSIPARQIAIKQPSTGDITDNIEQYWFSFDWKLRGRFRPYTVPAFGYGDKNSPEIFYLQNPSPQPLFALPDYFSGIQYAQIEEEISNYINKHIQNNFSAGKIVNVYQGEVESEEAEEEAENTIKSRLSGTSNAGQIIVAFNKNNEEKVEVDNIEITDAYQQFEFISKEARDKILLANKVTSPSLFGLQANTGFSSNSEEMQTALKTLYRNQINPMREVLLEGFTEILSEYYPNIKLKFKDFKELVTETENIQ